MMHVRHSIRQRSDAVIELDFLLLVAFRLSIRFSPKSNRSSAGLARPNRQRADTFLGPG